jgi:SPP1 gp7 family putative phage head morphogenesis protein
MALGFHLGTPRDSGMQRKMGDLLARKMASADLLGRFQVLRHAEKKTGRLFALRATSRAVRFSEDDADQVSAGFSFDMRGEDAERRIRELTPVTREIYDGLTAQYQRSAFTLAGTADLRLVQNVHDALAKIAAEGGTAADFKAAARKLTTEAGVEDLSAFTLDTAYNTAMQKAYSAGRLEQMQEPALQKALPYWQYWTVGDFRVRPEHAVLDGFTALAIDPVWLRIYPPSGFNCRCSVVPILASEAPKGSDEGGILRLPALARLKVPQKGFHTLIAA